MDTKEDCRDIPIMLPTYIQSCSRVFSALVAGVLTGISGVTGFVGFLIFILSQILVRVSHTLGWQSHLISFHHSFTHSFIHSSVQNAALLYTVSCKGQPRKFFSSPASVFLSGIHSQTEILTFILLWTFTNNLVYLF